MSNGKRFYWLKLQEDFFDSKRIKKLRKLAGGDTYTIIYLKMQLLAMKKNGILEYTGLEPTFADELALDIDESADNVSVTVNYLLSCGLLETSDEREYFVPYAVANTGKEGTSAKRVREHRERKALQCNTDVTLPALHCNGEKEIEKEIEIDKDIKADKPPRAPRFTPPSVEDVATYCRERGNGISPDAFIDYYTARDWTLGKGQKMKDWKAAVRTWENRRKETERAKQPAPDDYGDPMDFYR